MVLTKSDILLGKNNFKEINLESADDTICIRPLTIAEIQHIDEMKNKALGDYIANQNGIQSKSRVKTKINAQAKMNMEKITIADNRAAVKMVYWGLDNEGNSFKVTEQEIKEQMDPDIFFEILEKVKEISHINNDELEDDLEDFPEE